MADYAEWLKARDAALEAFDPAERAAYDVAYAQNDTLEQIRELLAEFSDTHYTPGRVSVWDHAFLDTEFLERLHEIIGDWGPDD